MKVRIKVQPTGYVSLDGGSLAAWPKVGTVVDLPDVIAEDLINAGNAEKAPIARADKPDKAQVEQRPAPTAQVEQRGPVKKATNSGA